MVNVKQVTTEPGRRPAELPRLDYLALFRNSPNPYMVLDRGLRFVDANDAYLHVTASRREDIIGRHILEAFPNDPDDPANEPARLLRESFDRVLQSRAPDSIALIPYRVPRHTESGVVVEDRFWSATHTPILDSSGEVQFILQHTMDVTDLQRLAGRRPGTAGTAVTPSEQVHAAVLTRANVVQEVNGLLEGERRQLLALFDQAPGFVAYLRGPEHTFELANVAYRQLVGGRNVVGKAIREALPEIAGQGFFELLDEVYKTQKPFIGRGMRARLRRAEGEPEVETELDFIYQPIIGADGRSIGILVQGQDITLRQRALLERDELRTLVEQASDFIGIASLDGEARYVNEAGRTLVGLGADKVSSTRVIEYFHPEDRKTVEEVVVPTALRGEEWAGDLRFQHFRTGETIFVRYKIFPLRDPQTGVVTALATVTTDISDRKRAEAELRRRSDFEQQLIGIVSHDLRNPLGAILLGTASLLHRDGQDERTTRTAARIQSAAERASRMVRDLLDFTQVRLGGGITIRPEPLDLHDLGRQVVDEVQMSYPERTFELHHQGDGRGAWDADRIAQVLANLLSNACKYGQADAPISVVIAGTPAQVEVRVSNRGPAIPTGVQERLFQPMQRGSQERDRTSRSVGLGLFIVKHIAEAHGGSVAITSSEAEGTTFSVRLPRHGAARAASAEA